MESVYVGRKLCREVIKAGRVLLDVGINPKIGCEDKNYQQLVEDGMDMETAMKEASLYSKNKKASDGAKYAVICEILERAKALVDAGINPEIVMR